MSESRGRSRRPGATGAGRLLFVEATTAVPVMSVVGADRAGAMARDHRDLLVGLLSRLVEHPTVAGTSALAAQQVLAAFLEEHGYRATQSPEDPAAWRHHEEFGGPDVLSEPAINLIARPAHVAELPVALFAHIDTEPVATGWHTDPFVPSFDGTRLYGLGAADDKAGVAATAVAAILLARLGLAAPMVLSLHGKAGGGAGTLPVFARLPRLDGAVYVHPAETGHGLRDLKHHSRGVLDIRIEVTGASGEPREIGTPESAPFDMTGNALDACLDLVGRVREALPDCVVNVGRLEAGDRPGTVPTRCEARVRILFDEPRRWRPLVEHVRDLAAAVPRGRPTGAPAVAVRIEASGLRANPAALDWDHPFTRLIRDAVTDVTGVDPRSYRDHMSSDIRLPMRLTGTPAVGIGCRAGNFYGPDEWVDCDDLLSLVAVLLVALSRWSSGVRS